MDVQNKIWFRNLQIHCKYDFPTTSKKGHFLGWNKKWKHVPDFYLSLMLRSFHFQFNMNADAPGSASSQYSKGWKS